MLIALFFCFLQAIDDDDSEQEQPIQEFVNNTDQTENLFNQQKESSLNKKRRLTDDEEERTEKSEDQRTETNKNENDELVKQHHKMRIRTRR